MEIIPDKKKLLDLVNRSVAGEVALPQFQRNFVWARDDIADLLLSIFKGYFVGTFILLRVEEGSSPFGARLIAGMDVNGQDNRTRWLILDGQQRLTSLHYVFASPDLPLRNTRLPYMFFLRLDKLPKKADEDFPDDLVFSERKDRCDQYLKRISQYETHILPFAEIPRWAEWQNDYERWLIEKDRVEYLDRYHPHIKPIWDRAINSLLSFNVPVIEMPSVKDDDAMGISEICAIFEKINSTGVPLSVYDLVTARLFKYGINVHELWAKTISEHQKIEAFSEGNPSAYGLYILRAIALLREQEIKGKALINLSPVNFVNEWKRAAEAVERALERLTDVSPDGFGVFDQKWQPYSTLVPVLAAALERFKQVHAGDYAFRALKCWYWGSIFLERYAGSVESTSYRDAMDLMKIAVDATFRPAIFEEIESTILENQSFSIRKESRVNSIYCGVMNLIAINGARDFLNADAVHFHELQDHHLFPVAFLREHLNLKGDPANSVVNHTLITSVANQRISRKSPLQYVNDVLPQSHRTAILRSHLIGAVAEKAMENNDYNTFIEAREKDILEFLRSYLEVAR